MASKIKNDIEIGSRYNDWKVLELAEKSKSGTTQYKCECVCGFIQLINSTGLRKGIRTRCSSCFHEIKRKRYQDNHIGKVYNGWKVIEHVDITINRSRTASRYIIEHTCGYRKTPKIFLHIKYKESRCWKCKPSKFKQKKD